LPYGFSFRRPLFSLRGWRSSFNCHFYELVTIATNPQKQYSCERVYARTMRNYRDAVLAYTETLKITKIKYRYNGKRSPKINATVIKDMAPLATIHPESGHAKLTPELEKAVSDAEARLGPA
jgi:hypothetical protein